MAPKEATKPVLSKEEKAKIAADKKAAKAAAKNVPALGATQPAPLTKDHIITQEDLNNDPSLEADGVKVGDVVQVEAENDPEEAAEAVSSNKIAAPKKGAKEVDVLRGTEYIRTYSEEVHGDDFMDLAQGLLDHSPQKEYSLHDSSAVSAILVSYRVQDKKSGIWSNEVRAFTSAKDGVNFKEVALGFKNSVKDGVATVK